MLTTIDFAVAANVLGGAQHISKSADHQSRFFLREEESNHTCDESAKLKRLRKGDIRTTRTATTTTTTSSRRIIYVLHRESQQISQTEYYVVVLLQFNVFFFA